ncbi:tetratricopeptide repeat protein [Leucobacter luti]|uniref:tetratricopeptide repeat protein n=1 Tax=Leucobacter luti TaxID=340320 RepID=UPI003D00817B
MGKGLIVFERALEAAEEAVRLGAGTGAAKAGARVRSLMPEVIGELGAGSGEHRRGLRVLAECARVSGDRARAAELFGELAQLAEQELTAGAADVLDDLLEARANLCLLSGDAKESADGVEVAAATRCDEALVELISVAEADLGSDHPRTFWLMEQRGRRLVTTNDEHALAVFDTLIARAAGAEEGGALHLHALGEKAAALSMLDRDGEAAMLWERVHEGRSELFGPDSQDALDAWWWQIRALYWADQVARADAELTRLLPVYIAVYGEDSEPSLMAARFKVRTLQRIGAEAGDAGRSLREDALELVRRIALLETARYGEESTEALGSRIMIVDLLDELDLPEDARLQAAILAEDLDHAFGGYSSLGFSLGRLRQRVLRRCAELPGQAEGARAEGLQALRRLRNLAVDGASAEDVENCDRFIDELRWTIEASADWYSAGTEERHSELAAGAEALASDTDGAAGLDAEILIRGRLSEELLAAERADDSLREGERSLELERALGNVPGGEGPAERVARSELMVALARRRLGRAGEAVEGLEAAIGEAVRRQVRPEMIARLRDVRALGLQELGRVDEAAEELAGLAEDSGEIGYLLDLSNLYLAVDRPAEAERVVRQALDRLGEAGEGEGPRMVTALGNLAIALCGQDRDEEAAQVYDTLLARQILLLGVDHRQTLATMHRRALEELHLGRPERAARLLERVLDRRVDALGAEDPDAISSLASLAASIRRAGDVRAALPLAERAAELSARVLGNSHPHTVGRVRALERMRQESARSE